MADSMGTFKQLLDTCTGAEIDALCDRYDGLYRYAKLLEMLARRHRRWQYSGARVMDCPRCTALRRSRSLDEFPQDPTKIRARIRRSERALRREQASYGFLNDGGGKRYLFGPSICYWGILQTPCSRLPGLRRPFPMMAATRPSTSVRS